MPKEVRLYECLICGEKYENFSEALNCEKMFGEPRIKFPRGTTVYFLHQYSVPAHNDVGAVTETEKVPAVVMTINRWQPSKIKAMQEEEDSPGLYYWPKAHEPIYTVKLETEENETIECGADELKKRRVHNNQ